MVMMNSTAFSSRMDRLSEEIFSKIFDYLWCVDILNAFLHLNKHFDELIIRYENYHVNFRLILKRDFDFISRYIQPHQIKSLILSDSRQTPGQSNIYLSRFPIEQFVRLRSISLFEIEDENRSLFENINQLKNLVLFQTDRLVNIQFIENIPRLKQLILTQFSDVDFNHVNLFDQISFTHLHSLTLPYCSYAQLRRILSEAVQLRKLNICLVISDCTGVDYFAEQHHNTTLSIQHLTLSIGTFTRAISRLLFERFLSRMKHLHNLELIVSSGGSVNLLEGNQWEIFLYEHLPFLSQFNFKFQLMPIDRQQYNEKFVLDSFRSSFWLDRDRPWYVGYNLDDLILYTIPHFLPRRLKSSFDSMTVPLDKYSMCYDRINEIEFDGICKSSIRFMNIQRVILSTNVFDENRLDLSKVEYLCVKSSAYSLKKLVEIIRKSMMSLNHLEIHYSLSSIQLRDVYPLEQIRILNLSNLSESIDLSLLFPSIEYLTIGISHVNQMVQIIDRLKHLSSASFHLANPIDQILTESDKMRQWLRDKSNRLSKDNHFTCRLEKTPDIFIHLWISNERPNSRLKTNRVTPRNRTTSRCACSLQ